MAQHDYNIANQSGADFRADLNNALLAIATVNSGATEPSTTFAHQLWVDTSSSVLKIRNAADNAWITTGVSITASNTFTGDLTGNVTGNLTGNVTGNVTGDLTGNADSADILSTARTISLSGDVVGSVSFDGSANVDIDTVVQINSITLGTDTTGDYVESLSGGTGVTVTGGTGEGSTPSVAIGQAVATTDDVTFNLVTATDEFVGDLDGAVRFSAKAGEALTKGDLVYVSGVSGDVPVVSKAKADDVSKMPVFGLAVTDANNNAGLQVATFGTLDGLDTSGVSEGQILYASTTAGAYTTTKPTGESSQIQNIGKVIRSHAAAGSIKIGGAGRSNDVPNLNNGKIFIGNASNQAITSTLDTSIVVENTNLYYTTARANTDFDTRLATKDTGDLTEGSNLYYTTARVNSDFDTRLATKSTTDLAEGTNLYYTSARFDSAFTSKDTDDLSEGTTNLYYTTARFDSAFGNKTTSDLTEGTNLYYTDTRANSAIDTRVTKAFVDALGIQASSVDANSVTLGTDTVGNYVATVTGTANKITVTGSGSESANITLSLPDDVQIASDLTVAGNLTVNGTLTSLDTTNLDIEDNLFQLNAGLTGSPVNDSGMLINRGDQDNGIFMWDESVDKFTLGLTTADGTATGNITLNSLGTLVANLEGAVTGTVSSLSNHDTGDLAEGSNLYYTDARSRGAISATGDISYNSSTGVISFTQSASPVTSVNTLTGAVVLDTDDIGEGSTNVYFTNARADTRINLQTGTNLDLSSKSTSDLSEGTNLYYTDARVQAVSINNVVEDTTPQLGGDLASNGNNILFGDNDKAIFGAGSDLEIYHDGSNSRIREVGTGSLLLDAESLYLRNTTGDSYLQGINGSAVNIFYDGSVKLVTTSTGIDVTGTATMDGLTVDGALATINSSGANSDLILTEGSTNTDARIRNSNGILQIGADINNEFGASEMQFSVDGKKFLSIDRFGDISFYDDTGTSPALFWDASAESLGIGTTSPSTALDISATTGAIKTTSSTGTNIAYNAILNTGGGLYLGLEQSTGGGLFTGTSGYDAVLGHTGAYKMHFATSNTIRTTIDSSGNVGIGDSSPAAKLEIKQGSSDWYEGIRINRSDNTTQFGTFSNNSGATFIGAADSAGGNNNAIIFGNSTNGTTFTERARISSDGNVQIADGGKLVTKTTSGEVIRFERASDSNRYSSIHANSTDAGGAFISFKVHDGSSATSQADVLHLLGNGNVGIGTDSPRTQTHILGTGQFTANITDAGSQGGTLTLSQNSGSAGSGGALLFAALNDSGNYKPQAGIKSLLDNGSGQGVGVLAFSTRASTSATALTERMRIDASGNLLVGTTSTSASVAGGRIFSTGRLVTSVDNEGHYFRRNSSDGTIVEFAKDGTTVGKVVTTATGGGSIVIGNDSSGIMFRGDLTGSAFIPADPATGNQTDNTLDIGHSVIRFDDVYATNGTIQTSDRNEKQDIEALTDAETRVAVAAKGLLRKFRWQSAVASKGDEARIHFGIIAQDLQDAFTAEGLDASDYAMFISTTWTNDDGVEQTRLGVRYSELLAFIIAGI